MLDKYAKDFADAKAIAKGAAKDIAADLIKLGTFTLDIFSPKTPKPQEAPFEKQPTPGVPDQAWLAAIEKSRKEAADLDRQFNLAVIEGIDRARLAEQYRFDDEQNFAMPRVVRVIVPEEHRSVTIAYGDLKINQPVRCSFTLPPQAQLDDRRAIRLIRRGCE